MITAARRAPAGIASYDRRVGRTFDELVALQRAAEQAQNRVEELRDQYGSPTADGGWSAPQTETYETAWRAWRDLARDARAAVSEYAAATRVPQYEVEEKVRQKVRHEEQETPEA